MIRNIFPILGLLGIPVLLSACLLPRPVEDRTRYFLLEASGVEELTGSAARYLDPDEPGLAIGLRRVRVADYINVPSIVVRNSDGQLRYTHYQRWAEGLDRGAARLLREVLRRDAAITSVYFFPEAGREFVDFEVEVQLLACDAIERDDGSGGYFFRAYWSIFDPESGGVIATGDFVRRGDWQPGDYSAFARNISRVGTEFGNEISEALLTLDGRR